MFDIFQLLVWGVLLILISSKIKSGFWLLVFSVVAGFCWAIEVVAVYMTGNVIDFRFYNHVDLYVVQSHGFQFTTAIMFFFVLFALAIFLLQFVSKAIRKTSISRHNVFTSGVIISLILLSLPKGLLNEAYQTYKILTAPEMSFNSALTDLGISPDEYVTPEKVTATKGKNIVVISLESLEQGFLGTNFNNIAPNLNALSKKWTYFDQMTVGEGGNWTAGSLYKHQVGMPAFFPGQGNDFFQGTKEVRITGLSHVLKKAGYKIRYLMGNAQFAGMYDLLSAYEIPVVTEKNTLGKYPKVPWGLNDLDLFKEAKLQVKKLAEDGDKPFAFFMSTINTHAPNGLYDARMEKFISLSEDLKDLCRQADSWQCFEFSVSAVDYLISDFIGYLEQEGLIENTAIFIFPDHELLGNSGPIIEILSKSHRRLYLLTNVAENKLTKKPTDRLFQIDLPGVIINGAEIETNAKFLADFISEKGVTDFLAKNIIKISTLNAASLNRLNFNNGIDIKLIGSYLVISSDQDIFSLKYGESLGEEAFDFTFTEDMNLISHQETNRESFFILNESDKEFNRRHLVVKINENKIEGVYFGNKQLLGIYKRGDRIHFSKNDIQLTKQTSGAFFDIYKKGVSKIQYDPSIVSITSSEFITSQVNRSEIRFRGNQYELTRGLNLLTLGNDRNVSIRSFDTWGSVEASNQFLEQMESQIVQNKFWVVAVHDAIKTNHPNFQKKLTELGFSVLQTLDGRVAYIAYSDSSNNIIENSSETSLTVVTSVF